MLCRVPRTSTTQGGPSSESAHSADLRPTKTLEYLAAGMPVLSTRVADVLSGYQGVVRFADDADGFAAACREELTSDAASRAEATAHGAHPGA
jgi:glycosyltransferase involved in cell wall biosynthesis